MAQPPQDIPPWHSHPGHLTMAHKPLPSHHSTAPLATPPWHSHLRTSHHGTEAPAIPPWHSHPGHPTTAQPPQATPPQHSCPGHPSSPGLGCPQPHLHKATRVLHTVRPAAASPGSRPRRRMRLHHPAPGSGGRAGARSSAPRRHRGRREQLHPQPGSRTRSPSPSSGFGGPRRGRGCLAA